MELTPIQILSKATQDQALVPAAEASATGAPQGQASAGTSNEQLMLLLVNEEREKAGLQPLKLDGELSEAARAHTRDMHDNEFFSHVSSRTGSLRDRLHRAGITYRAAGENIGMAASIRDVNRLLFESPGHRANLLNPEFTHLGLGILAQEDGTFLVTQVFMKPVPSAEPREAERELLAGMKGARTRLGELPVSSDPLLQGAARANSSSVARSGEISLPDLGRQLDRTQPRFDRIRAHVFLNRSLEEILSLPILRLPAITGVGIGVARGGDGAHSPVAVTLLLGESEL